MAGGGLTAPLVDPPPVCFGGASPAAEAVTARQVDTYLMWGEPPAAQARYRRMDPVGQARMAALHAGSADGLTVAPNLWAGVGLVREGAGTALVGSYAEVAARIDEYAAHGVDEFVLSGWPHREEAERVDAEVLPRVAASLAVIPAPVG